MESEKVKEIKELLRCMNGEKACTNCYINEVAQEQETCCINVVADMTLELINELESENEKLKNIGLNEEITVGEYLQENQQLKDQIAELEKENEILQGTKDRLTFAERINIVNNAVEIKLKQFAERLKEKLKEKVNADNVDVFVECAKLSDETLKEFIENKYER